MVAYFASPAARDRGLTLTRPPVRGVRVSPTHEAASRIMAPGLHPVSAAGRCRANGCWTAESEGDIASSSALLTGCTTDGGEWPRQHPTPRLTPRTCTCGTQRKQNHGPTAHRVAPQIAAPPPLAPARQWKRGQSGRRSPAAAGQAAATCRAGQAVCHPANCYSLCCPWAANRATAGNRPPAGAASLGWAHLDLQRLLLGQLRRGGSHGVWPAITFSPFG